MAGGNAFAVIHDHKNGWNPEAFRERYSDVLDRFDYIVGDWGYQQLRLRGFYRDGHPRATKDSTISSLVDYINEYCNFGCAYFVVSKTDVKDVPPEQLTDLPSTPEAAVALSETGEQIAETAATISGPITRWPQKERAGGPTKVPNITVSAVARAAAESAERRNAHAANNASSGNSQSGRDSNNRNQGRSNFESNGGHERERRPNHRGQGNPNQGNQEFGQGKSNNSHRAPRPSGDNRQQGETDGGQTGESTRSGNRWQGKNRRRKNFSNRPNEQRSNAPSKPEA
ncbi:MAG: DUF1027 domain-containing protein [Candidatus Cohnella colombiensis]|uniref:DUF1027 domain-containing protein n=1 Tax=Candidatus Cohnella colombiensis TaxID=3121368 RepID=A0AA95F0V4_9BACL|nr:MAG: DUF1027 domain-containing protein [Cohnella sp.]